MNAKVKTIYSAALVILIVIIIWLLYIYRGKLISHYENQYANMFIEATLTKDILRSCLTNSNRNIGLTLSQDIILKDTSGHEIELSDLIGSRSKLIYRIADTYCSSCVDSGFKSLIQNASNFLEEDIIVVGSFLQSSDYVNFVNTTKAPFRILQVMGSIDLQVEELGFPYFIVVDQEDSSDQHNPFPSLPFGLESFKHFTRITVGFPDTVLFLPDFQEVLYYIIIFKFLAHFYSSSFFINSKYRESSFRILSSSFLHSDFFTLKICSVL